jgi:Fe-Mn family superoxide dismutase
MYNQLRRRFHQTTTTITLKNCTNYNKMDNNNNSIITKSMQLSTNVTGGKTDLSLLLPKPYEMKPLPFNPNSLKGLSEKLIVSHWENNYGGALKALNVIEKKLAEMMLDDSLPPYVYGDLKREQLLRKGSVVLHELYFANLGGDGKPPSGEIVDALKENFGSVDKWQAEFKRTALALAGGPGWTILAFDGHANGRLCNFWGQDHMHTTPLSIPLLVLDMYEHAFHIDFGAAAVKYVDAFLDNVNWNEVNRRFLRAKRQEKL